MSEEKKKTTKNKITKTSKTSKTSKTAKTLTKKATTKKISKKEIENVFLLLTFLLSSAAVFITALNSYSFNIAGNNINYSVCVIPALIFISNYTTKKLGFGYSLKSILITILFVIAFTILIYDMTRRQVNPYELFANSFSILISLFINLSVYYYIITNIDVSKEKLYVYLNYIFTTLIYHMIYLLFNYHLTIGDGFWNLYFISIAFEIILSVVALYFDVKIKRGLK